MSEEVTAKKSDSTIIYFLVGLGLGSVHQRPVCSEIR